jgi:hypothetical protein
MKTKGSPGYAAIVASSAAGPIFLISLFAAILYLQTPSAIPFGVGEAAALAAGSALLVPAFLVGFFLALLPNLVGASVMAALAETVEEARAPVAWVAAGALGGAGIAVLSSGFGSDPPIAFALIVTGGLCAGICRRTFAWDDGQS